MGLLEQWSVYTIYWYMSDFLKPPKVVQVVKNSPAKAGDVRNAGSTPGSGRSLGEGNGNPFQCSCLENPMDRGAWWAPWGRKESDTTDRLTFLFFLVGDH